MKVMAIVIRSYRRKVLHVNQSKKDMTSKYSTFDKRLKEVQRFDARNAVACHVEAAEKLVADYPENAKAWLELGAALTEIARYKEAKKALDKSARFCRPHSRYFPYFWKGHLYQQQGNLRLAERWFRRSLGINPKYADCWGFLGSNLAKQGRFKEAKLIWRKQIQLGSSATEEGHFNLGLLLRAEKRYKDSLKHAEKAIQLDPKYTEAKQLRKDLLQVLNL